MEWRLGGRIILQNGDKYEMKQRGLALELIIKEALPEDSGVYSCVCRDQKTKATVKILGRVNNALCSNETIVTGAHLTKTWLNVQCLT